jgi:hypothetical protein
MHRLCRHKPVRYPTSCTIFTHRDTYSICRLKSHLRAHSATLLSHITPEFRHCNFSLCNKFLFFLVRCDYNVTEDGGRSDKCLSVTSRTPLF